MSLTSLAEKRGVGLSKTQSISNLSFVSNATSRTSRMSKSKSTMNLSKVSLLFFFHDRPLSLCRIEIFGLHLGPSNFTGSGGTLIDCLNGPNRDGVTKDRPF